MIVDPLQESISKKLYEQATAYDFLLNSVGITGITLLIVALAALGIVIIVIYTESQIASLSNNIIEKKVNGINVFASKSSLRLSDAVTILNITGSLPQMTTTPNTSLINQQMHGIPQFVEPEKRGIAKTILKNYPNFDTVSLLLPNGDVYFVEPFASQMNLTLTNFAFRDYFKGVITTGKPYISEIIRSNATGHMVSVISIPVYDKINSSLASIWLGALNLRDVKVSITQSASSSELIAYVDQNGNRLVSNNDKLYSDLSQGDRTFATNLSSFKHAIDGESGYSIESINNTHMFVAYAPINATSSTWAALSFEPYNDVFAVANSLRLNGISMCLILGGGAALVIVLFNRSFRSLNRLTNQLINKDKELQKYNDELISVEKAKDEFMSMINHELKTPLVPIKGYADMLIKTNIMGELSEKQKKAVRSISYNVGKLELLVSDILDVYKLDMGKLRLAKKDVDVRQMVDSNIQEFKRLADEKNVNIKSDVQYEGLVHCDQRRIDQVITNLIKNAIDFVAPNTGRILIHVFKDEDKKAVAFSVEDNGTGIPSEKIDSLFKKFYQIDTTLTRKHGGTGLGLAISKGIIEAHGGEMWVDKEFKDGARFMFILPIQDDLS
ncbi:MAG TPA: sensor histidine kinase [Nitrososphaeraceae archaeon]|jgi:signal transduction histidine kinase